MGYFIFAFLFALLQMYLLKNLTESLTAGNRKKSIRFFLAKFAVYAVGIYLVVFVFVEHIFQIFCGFIAGLPIVALLYFLYTQFYKKKK